MIPITSQTNESTSYTVLDIMAHNTILDSYQITNLDGGRLSIPVPEWGFLKFGEYHQVTREYKYYVEGSDRCRVLDFLYNPENSDERLAFQNLMNVVLVYHSEEERKTFEGYVVAYPEKIDSLVSASKEFDYIARENELKASVYKKSLRIGIALNALLREWRRMDL